MQRSISMALMSVSGPPVGGPPTSASPHRLVLGLTDKPEPPVLREMFEKRLLGVSGDGKQAARISRRVDGTVLIRHSKDGETVLRPEVGTTPRIVAVTSKATKIWGAFPGERPGLWIVSEQRRKYLQPLDALEGVMRTPRAQVPFGTTVEDGTDKVRYVFGNGSFVVDRGSPVIGIGDGGLLAVSRSLGGALLEHFDVANPRNNCESEVIEVRRLPISGVQKVWPLRWNGDYAFVYETDSGFHVWMNDSSESLPDEIERVWCSPWEKGVVMSALVRTKTAKQTLERSVAFNGEILAHGALLPLSENGVVWSPGGTEVALMFESMEDQGEGTVKQSVLVSQHSHVQTASGTLREPLVDDHGAILGYVTESEQGFRPTIYEQDQPLADFVWNLRLGKGNVTYNRYEADKGAITRVIVDAP